MPYILVDIDQTFEYLNKEVRPEKTLIYSLELSKLCRNSLKYQKSNQNSISDDISNKSSFQNALEQEAFE